MATRTRNSAQFKANVALEAIQAELTMPEQARKYGIHPATIDGWTEVAIESMVSALSRKAEVAPAIPQKDREKLHVPVPGYICWLG
ncbi:transposase [Pontibaca salina]|uniref:Transposase n=1 Tax=Pontibaca salina TaxID=2795731 RepID=A0A934HKW4_9RHOB|nr:transposase [Pontibaca salina]MBI6630064.1 transposase [Pontibaca salina]